MTILLMAPPVCSPVVLVRFSVATRSPRAIWRVFAHHPLEARLGLVALIEPPRYS